MSRGGATYSSVGGSLGTLKNLKILVKISLFVLWPPKMTILKHDFSFSGPITERTWEKVIKKKYIFLSVRVLPHDFYIP